MVAPLTIAFDAKRAFQNTTGLGNYARTLLGNLQQYHPEHEYILFTPKRNENLETSLQTPLFDIIEPTRKTPLWRSYQVGQLAQKKGCQLFHGLSNELPFGIKTKSIVTIHDLIFKHYPHTYSRFDRWIYDLKSKYACQNADVIIAISESTKRDIVDFYGISEEKIQVIYQPCHPIYYQKDTLNLAELRNKLQLPQEFILNVGSLIERKNVLTLLQAIQLCKEDTPPLVIIGKGKKYKSKLQQYIQENHLEKRVIFLEKYLSLKELRAVYEMASVMVYPSICEGFGLPVVEALLCKTPVITSNVSALPEAGGKGAILVNPLNAEEISLQIEIILSNEKQQKQMKEEGYIYASNIFHPEKTTHQLITLYQNILC